MLVEVEDATKSLRGRHMGSGCVTRWQFVPLTRLIPQAGLSPFVSIS
jgi:hypothetical protein